jgi:CubicO group peptidase (beta-lactamase class C family)
VSARTVWRSSLTWTQATLVLLGASLFFVPPARSEDQASIEDQVSVIDQYLKTRIANKPFSVKVLVARGDHVLIQREYGHSGLNQWSIEGDVEDRFPVGAIAEQFVAAAVLHLKEQGKLRIDAPICSYLSTCPTGWAELQVVHLLTHTSGLPSLKRRPPSQKMSLAPHTLRDLVAAVDGERLEFKPGSMFKCSTLDFPVLYLLIGSVTGRLPTEYIETEVFGPLGMTDTKYPSSEEPPATLPKSQVQDGRTGTSWDVRFCEEDVCSTVQDLYRWERALTKGTAISHYSGLQMFTPYRDGYGFGWKIMKEFDKRVALQSGRSHAFSLSVRLYPDDDTCIVLVANGDNIDSVDLTHDIAAILFGMRHSGFQQ